ncbi:Oidioi.mRNA.OKI2018_I69.chr1.g3839.t1.cds [Oikopleura dioica]|uniref:Oidioi.mRNA.OKI2018_I69.chr1.g3839.t1.cds n=1 Tax=Oikopleura dioica TaxID=34765 RepID=A0ABN7SZN2_OIKDI|nr:Oidioi.mRNA.OKI2018_I69.chr1.g3839.t1.cds [Oikopleura dioica]
MSESEATEESIDSRVSTIEGQRMEDNSSQASNPEDIYKDSILGIDQDTVQDSMTEYDEADPERGRTKIFQYKGADKLNKGAIILPGQNGRLKPLEAIELLPELDKTVTLYESTKEFIRVAKPASIQSVEMLAEMNNEGDKQFHKIQRYLVRHSQVSQGQSNLATRHWVARIVSHISHIAKYLEEVAGNREEQEKFGIDVTDQGWIDFLAEIRMCNVKLNDLEYVSALFLTGSGKAIIAYIPCPRNEMHINLITSIKGLSSDDFGNFNWLSYIRLIKLQMAVLATSNYLRLYHIQAWDKSAIRSPLANGKPHYAVVCRAGTPPASSDDDDNPSITSPMPHSDHSNEKLNQRRKYREEKKNWRETKRTEKGPRKFRAILSNLGGRIRMKDIINLIEDSPNVECFIISEIYASTDGHVGVYVEIDMSTGDDEKWTRKMITEPLPLEEGYKHAMELTLECHRMKQADACLDKLETALGELIDEFENEQFRYKRKSKIRAKLKASATKLRSIIVRLRAADQRKQATNVDKIGDVDINTSWKVFGAVVKNANQQSIEQEIETVADSLVSLQLLSVPPKEAEPPPARKKLPSLPTAGISSLMLDPIRLAIEEVDPADDGEELEDEEECSDIHQGDADLWGNNDDIIVISDDCLLKTCGGSMMDTVGSMQRSATRMLKLFRRLGIKTESSKTTALLFKFVCIEQRVKCVQEGVDAKYMDELVAYFPTVRKMILISRALLENPSFITWLNDFQLIPSGIGTALGLFVEDCDDREEFGLDVSVPDSLAHRMKQYAATYSNRFKDQEEVEDFILDGIKKPKDTNLDVSTAFKLFKWIEGGGIRLSKTTASLNRLERSEGQREWKLPSIQDKFYRLASRVIFGEYNIPPTMMAGWALPLAKDKEIKPLLDEITISSGSVKRFCQALTMRPGAIATVGLISTLYAEVEKAGGFVSNGLDLQWKIVDSISSIMDHPSLYEIRQLPASTTDTILARCGGTRQDVRGTNGIFTWESEMSRFLGKSLEKTLTLDMVLKKRLGSSLYSFVNAFVYSGLSDVCSVCDATKLASHEARNDDEIFKRFELFRSFLSISTEKIWRAVKGPLNDQLWMNVLLKSLGDKNGPSEEINPKWVSNALISKLFDPDSTRHNGSKKRKREEYDLLAIRNEILQLCPLTDQLNAKRIKLDENESDHNEPPSLESL